MTAANDAEFASHAEAFRAELVAHCYRMVGSFQDAEDLTHRRGSLYVRAS